MIATTARMTTMVHASAVTTPITILNRIHAPTRASTITRALRTAERTESLMPRIVSEALKLPLKEVRRPRRRVPVQPGQRLRAHHPSRPEHGEAERSEAAQQPPGEGRGEHVQVLGLEHLGDPVEGAEHNWDVVAGRGADGRADLPLRAHPAKGLGLAGGGVEHRKARAVAREELVEHGTAVADCLGLEPLPL